ncbi:MAG: EamA family transporter [Acidobacteriaceae bacterium]
MTIWILFAIFAYLLLAITGVFDKFFLSHVESHPVVYAFFLGISGPLSFVLAPFGLKMISAKDLLIALVAGSCFTIALYFLYDATRKTSISRVLPINGGLTPLFTLILAYFFLGERLSIDQNIGFVFLVLGAVLISLRKERGGWQAKALKSAIISSFLFAASFVLTKHIFDVSNFVSGMIWTRLGFFFTALALIIPKRNRELIFHAPKKIKPKNIFIYYGSRGIGNIGGFLQNYAISVGSVSIVNAMQGVQFVFLLIITTLLSLKYPQIIKERINSQSLSLKIASIILISTGLYLVAIK